jgi:cytochrome d ubiquinol oxidase subunit I
MIAIGTFLAILGGFSLYRLWKRNSSRRLLWIVALSGPLGFVALEAGWTVTETGRQPWIIYGVMKTADAVTPMPGLVYPMMLFTGVYLFLSFVVTWLMVRQFRNVD